MRLDDWELLITVDGQPLQEYDVDGHVVFAVQPGKTFVIKVEYHGGGNDPYAVQILIDGKQTGNWLALDPTSTTRNASSLICSGWKKSEGGHDAITAFKFVATPLDDQAENSCSLSVGQTNWQHGVVELQVEKAAFEVAKDILPWPGVQCDTTPAEGLSERELVKGGLSASVGRGETAFHNHESKIMSRAGEVFVARVKGQAVHSYCLHYRDNFFLALRGHVNLDDGEEQAETPKGRGKATQRRIKNLRAHVKRIQQTQAKLKKRRKVCSPVKIDLTCSDDED